MRPGPSREVHTRDQCQHVDDGLDGPTGSLGPNPVFEVVEHIHGTEVKTSTGSQQQEQQGAGEAPSKRKETRQ